MSLSEFMYINVNDRYLVLAEKRELDITLYFTRKFAASNTEIVPSSKQANTIRLSHENVAWEMDSNPAGFHWKYSRKRIEN